MRKSHIAFLPLPLLFVLILQSYVPDCGAFAADGDDRAVKEEEKEEIREVVVTATRLNTPAEEVGSSITVITDDQIDKMQKRTVLDVLRSVPALDVVQSGGPGGATSVFMRGAKSEHTLVLIDGVEMNDPISTGRGYDFAHLSVDGIERIEILRGPQSTLYGSDAIGGVINIITKRGKGKTSGFASLEGGSFNSFRGAAGGSGGNEWMQYSLGFSRWDTDGISAADEEDGNTEKDGYENTSLYGSLGFAPADIFDLDFTLRFTDAESGIDNAAGPGGDDPNSTEESKQLFFRTQGRLYLFDDIWEQKLGFSLTDHDRYSRNDTDAAHPDDLSRSSFDGRMLKFDWQNNFYIHDTNTVTFGIETEEEKGESNYYSESAWGPYTSAFVEQTARTTGYYFQDQVELWDSWFTTVGVRWDDHSKFGVETTYRIASAYLVQKTGTKFKGSYGTGFKAPTLYQLYSDYGDENLNPEESTGWDFGLEQSLFDGKAAMGAAIFHNEFDDLIDFDSGTWTYVNVARAVSKGIEIFGSAHPADNLDFRFSYAYTNTKDITTGEDLLRRADNKFSFNLNYGFPGKGNANLEIVYVGERDDDDFSTYPATRMQLDGYVLVNPAFSFQISENIEMFGRVENLFDRDYEEISGYGTPGISVYGGIKVLFSGM